MAMRVLNFRILNVLDGLRHGLLGYFTPELYATEIDFVSIATVGIGFVYKDFVLFARYT